MPSKTEGIGDAGVKAKTNRARDERIATRDRLAAKLER